MQLGNNTGLPESFGTGAGLQTLTLERQQSVMSAPLEVKAKAVAKKDLTGDWLQDTHMVIENLQQHEAVNQLTNLTDQSDRSWYCIGGILSQIRDNQWWQIKGYASFDDFVEDELGIAKARAASWMRNYRAVLNLGITTADLSEVGWTKLKDALPYMTSTNKDELLGHARTLTCKAFITYLKGLAGETKKKKTTSVGSGSSVVKFSCMLHEDEVEVVDEALKRAKARANSEYDNVGLALLCSVYLNGGGDTMNAGSVVDAMRQMGADSLQSLIQEAFPNLTVMISENAAFDPISMGASDNVHL